MKLSKKFISFTLALSFISLSAHAKCDQKATYVNQRGSNLELCYHKNHDGYTGNLSGTFTSAVGNCKADINNKLPISGFFNYNAVAIAINFPNCGQVVAMTGTITDNELHTIWLDAAKADDPVTKNWNSNVVGADYYKKVEDNN
jgi:hypothetical protein